MATAPATTLAYLVIESEAGVWYGGLLAIERYGRPVEFHCTAPVDPSPAHRILYGPTLERYVAVELIGPALLGRLKRRPAAILAEGPHCLEIRGSGHIPVLTSGLDCHPDHPGDRKVWERVWASFAPYVDREEPFERVRRALKEARRGAQAA